MNDLREVLVENPVIAAIRNHEDLKRALNSNIQVVFVLYGNIMNVSSICKKLKEKNKTIFVHIDLIEGLKGDSEGIKFIKKYAEPNGIISTKVSNIKYAKKIGLTTILRIFIIDSLSLGTGIKNLQDIGPSAAEVMPGVASKIIKKIENKVKIPVIAGGLVETKKDVIESLSSGAIAVSTTKKELWLL